VQAEIGQGFQFDGVAHDLKLATHPVAAVARDQVYHLGSHIQYNASIQGRLAHWGAQVESTRVPTV
jgi:hypothetical protein